MLRAAHALRDPGCCRIRAESLPARPVRARRVLARGRIANHFWRPIFDTRRAGAPRGRHHAAASRRVVVRLPLGAAEGGIEPQHDCRKEVRHVGRRRRGQRGGVGGRCVHNVGPPKARGRLNAARITPPLPPRASSVDCVRVASAFPPRHGRSRPLHRTTVGAGGRHRGARARGARRGARDFNPARPGQSASDDPAEGI